LDKMARDLIKITSGSTVVYVDSIDVKENWNNAIKVITIPSTNSTPEISQLINLNKVERRLTITGYLTNSQYSSETYTTALAKKNGLTNLFSNRAVFTLSWDGTDLVVMCDKYEIAYKALDDKDSTATETVVYDVVISVIVGEAVI